MDLYRLGRTDIYISPIGLGCWQFSNGGGLAGGFWDPVPQEEVNEIVRSSLNGGVNWFDTAEAYGNGRSERALATALGVGPQPATTEGTTPPATIVATKWMPLLRFAGSITRTISERQAALSPWPIDLFQVHFPASLSSIKAQMDAMAALVRAERIRSVGVSNFSADQMRRAHKALAAHGLTLASNQVKYSLLDREIERNGILDAAKELGVSIVAYSPLAQGILTGKFHEDPSLAKKRKGPRKWMSRFRSSGLEKSRPLVDRLAEIAQAHEATATQVALAWTVQFHDRHVVAIPGASKRSHAEQNAGSMRIRLSAEELSRIDESSRQIIGMA
jgi:aryl-alcohol dehydrogenase-like predicted oxidoreductase